MSLSETTDDWKPVFSCEHIAGLSDEDNMEAVVHNGGVSITIENPWAGSTETGFGYSTSIRVDKPTARRFAKWLIQWADNEPILEAFYDDGSPT